MTDKTDTPELRRFNFEIWPHEAYISEAYDGEYVLFADANKQIEAERRKGDLWFGKVADLDAALKAERQRADNANTGWGKVIDERDNIRSHAEHYAQLAGTNAARALKGEQVPVANPVLAYAESYRAMARRGSDFVPIWGVITDLERNIAPLFTAPQKPVISKEKLCDWLEGNFDIDDSQRDAFAACFAHCCDCVVQSHSPAPVGEIVAWAGTDREKGITREVDFRFLRFDVLPGTKLYAVEPEPAAKSDLLTRAQVLAVETRALACRIKAGD